MEMDHSLYDRAVRRRCSVARRSRASACTYLPNRVATYEPRNSGPSLSPLKTRCKGPGGNWGGEGEGREGGRGKPAEPRSFSPGGGDGPQMLQFTFLSRAPAPSSLNTLDRATLSLSLSLSLSFCRSVGLFVCLLFGAS